MSDYTSDNIKNLQFPESVRLRPGMYIGSTDGAGIGVITREPLDNIVDEALEGHATQCDVHLSSKGIYIIDDGRGIPHGFTEIVNPADGSKNKVPTLRAVFGVLHTSGKFNDEAYKISRGVHGVGVKSTNALSSEFEVFTFNKGKWRTILFNKGKLVTDVTECKAPRHPRTNQLLAKGTLIRFLPDKLIFKDSKLSPAELFAWAKMAAYFTPNLIIALSTDKEGSLRTLHYPAGPKQYLTDRIAELAKKTEFGLLDEAVFYSTSNAHDCILKFTSYDGCDARAFTNGLENVDGGFHVASMLNALRESVQPYATKKQVFTLIELRDGLIGLINAKMSGPQFTSQTKEKLADARAEEPLKALLLADFAIFFKKNRKLAESICERSSRLKELKSKFVASKQMLTALKRISRKGFPAKAATAPKCKPAERELYLLEGDSASGGMRFARFEYFQEFLPLKGKPPNVMRDKKSADIVNEEILNIFAMLGLDPKNEDPMTKLRIGKIILMPDSDADGSHIATLLGALLHKYIPQVFDMGMMYVTRVPEYYAIANKIIYYGNTMDAVKSDLARDKIKADINHLKGYGECPSDLLRIFACDPKTRLLTKLNPAADERFELLMSSDTTSRKILLGI